jgi:hypothetical protein
MGFLDRLLGRYIRGERLQLTGEGYLSLLSSLTEEKWLAGREGYLHPDQLTQFAGEVEKHNIPEVTLYATLINFDKQRLTGCDWREALQKPNTRIAISGLRARKKGSIRNLLYCDDSNGSVMKGVGISDNLLDALTGRYKGDSSFLQLSFSQFVERKYPKIYERFRRDIDENTELQRQLQETCRGIAPPLF